MPRFSLVVPTVNRTAEFDYLLKSLIAQKCSDLELIVIDQNQDDRLVPYIQTAQPSLVINHVRAPKDGASRARNIGLRYISGDIVAFPDDDCWYTPGLLNHIDEWFQQNKDYDILAIGANDDAGLRSGNRWPLDVCDIKPLNAIRTTFCNSLFFRSASLPPGIEFDETFFPGEETDLVLRLLQGGLKGRFDRTWHVGHPRRDMLSGTATPDRAMLYGRSIGQLLRKHSLYVLWALLVLYDLLRALVVALTGRLKSASLCLAHGRGIIMGILMKP
jgi:glycosyltransferase involved in cell wall biosynthesis